MSTRRNVLIGAGAVGVAGGALLLARHDMGSMARYNAAVGRSRVPMRPGTDDLVRFATLAASGHNTQPWRFRVHSDQIDILPDLARRTPAVDPDDHHLFVGLGCAAANLALASAAQGRPGEIGFDSDDGGFVRFVSGAGAAAASMLFDAIPRRQSTRAEYGGRAVSPADLAVLAAAAVVPGVDLVLITVREKIDQVRDLVLAGNTAQMADAAFRRELVSWLRFSPRHAARMGDGLFSAASGQPALPEWLGPTVFERLVSTESENKAYAMQMRATAALAVFVGRDSDPAHWVQAGIACQRFALQATALGLSHAFMNQPVEVASLRPELAALAGLPGRRPDLLMRFGYGKDLPFSARRPVEAVIIP